MDDPQLRKVVGSYFPFKWNDRWRFFIGLVGHASNLCCPLCTFSSNPHHSSVEDVDPEHELPDKRPRTGQSFENPYVNVDRLLHQESLRSDDEWKRNQEQFRDLLHCSDVTPKKLAEMTVKTGMRDTCLSHLKGFDFGRLRITIVFTRLLS